MNINLKLKLPIVSNTNPLDAKLLLVSTHILLNPLYALEEDIITPFTDIEDSMLPYIRQALFNASITTFRLTSTIDSLQLLSPDELFSLRRDLTICIATNEVAKQLSKDLVASISRSKTLGDFSVSTSKKGDGSIIRQILEDSLNCVAEIKALIESIEQKQILPSTFVKGRLNASSRTSSRLWWTSEIPLKIVDGYASKKFYYNGHMYKASTFNLDSYLRYSGSNLADYYRALAARSGRGSASGQNVAGIPHSHDNLNILDKIGQDSEGNLQYDGSYPLPGVVIDNW